MNAWIENRRRAVAREQAPRAEVVEPAIDGTVATLRLYDPIDSWGEWWGLSAKEFAEMLDALPSDVNEIRLHINSPGGEVFEAVAISNQLRRTRPVPSPSSTASPPRPHRSSPSPRTRP